MAQKNLTLIYVGPYDEVEIPALGLVCKQGEPFTVPVTPASEDLSRQASFKIHNPKE